MILLQKWSLFFTTIKLTIIVVFSKQNFWPRNKNNSLFYKSLYKWILFMTKNKISYLSGYHHRNRFTKTISIQLIQTRYFASVHIDSSFREHSKTPLWCSTRILTQVMNVRTFTRDFVVTDVAVALREGRKMVFVFYFWDFRESWRDDVIFNLCAHQQIRW